jgi:hypothetical protein
MKSNFNRLCRKGGKEEKGETEKKRKKDEEGEEHGKEQENLARSADGCPHQEELKTEQHLSLAYLLGKKGSF